MIKYEKESLNFESVKNFISGAWPYVVDILNIFLGKKTGQNYSITDKYANYRNVPMERPRDYGYSYRSPAKTSATFDKIIFETDEDCMSFKSAVLQAYAKYGAVTVGELIELCGGTPEYTDWQKGWKDLTEESIRFVRARNGFRVIMPPTVWW